MDIRVFLASLFFKIMFSFTSATLDSVIIEKPGLPVGPPEGSRPSVDVTYSIFVKLWASVVKNNLAFFRLTHPKENEFIGVLSDWVDDWTTQVIEQPVGAYGDGFKDDFWRKITPKVDSLLKSYIECGSINEVYAESLRTQLRITRVEFDSKLLRFTDITANVNPKNFVTNSGSASKMATPLYEEIIRRWCELFEASVHMAVGDTANMTNGELFLNKLSKWVYDWSVEVVDLLPGENGAGWREHFWQTIKPLVSSFFRQQEPMIGNQPTKHVRSREAEVLNTFEMLETGEMEKAGRYGSKVGRSISKPATVSLKPVKSQEKAAPLSQTITHKEEL